MDIMMLDFDQWLEIGMRAGFVSPPVCHTHDGVPMSITEEADFMEGSDPCIHVMRCYESKEMKEAVEANSFTITEMRNPFRGEFN